MREIIFVLTVLVVFFGLGYSVVYALRHAKQSSLTRHSDKR